MKELSWTPIYLSGRNESESVVGFARIPTDPRVPMGAWELPWPADLPLAWAAQQTDEGTIPLYLWTGWHFASLVRATDKGFSELLPWLGAGTKGIVIVETQRAAVNGRMVEDPFKAVSNPESDRDILGRAEWQKLVDKEVQGFCGEMEVNLEETRTEGPGRQSAAYCGETSRQLSGLPWSGWVPPGEAKQVAARVLQILENLAIDAALRAVPIPQAPANRVHNDRHYGSFTMTDSEGSVKVKVKFANGTPVECHAATPAVRKYSNLD